MTTAPSLFAPPREPVTLPLHLTIPHAPRTKKNSGTITKRGRAWILRPSEAWLAWRDLVLMDLKDVWRAKYELDIDLSVRAWFYRDRAQGDAVGFYQGLADVLGELRLVDDDVRLVAWDGSRLLIDRACPRTEIVLSAYSPTLPEPG